MDRCKNGYIINEDGTIPERCHVDWDDGFYPTVCKECPFYNSEYFMNTSEAINLLEVIKFCDVDELAKIKAIDMAIIALQEKEKREYNPKLTLEDLQQQKYRWIWWDNFGGVLCQCKNGYVITDDGTFSFDFVLSNGSAYARKPDTNI